MNTKSKDFRPSSVTEHKVEGLVVSIMLLAGIFMISGLYIYLEITELHHSWPDSAWVVAIPNSPLILCWIFFKLVYFGRRWVFEENGIRMFRYDTEVDFVKFSEIESLRRHGRVIVTRRKNYRVIFPRYQIGEVVRDLRRRVDCAGQESRRFRIQ
jgi:hypothetical protein